MKMRKMLVVVMALTAVTSSRFAMAWDEPAQGCFPDGPCTNFEKLKLKCPNGTFPKATVKNATPGELIKFCIDGGNCVCATVGRRGKAQVILPGGSGTHGIEATLPCGRVLFEGVVCGH